MNRWKFIVVFFAVASVSLAGCSGSDKAQSTADNPRCPTVMEGFYHAGNRSAVSVPSIEGPAICVREHSKKVRYDGDILRVDSIGILFWPKSEGPFYHPESTFYAYENIVWAVNRDNKLIFGKVPDEDVPDAGIMWEIYLELKNLSPPNEHKFSVVLKPNEWFSFCMEPGDYAVTEWQFRSGREYVDRAEPLPNMTFHLYPNVVNYVGDMYIDLRPDSLPGVHRIRTKMLNRPGRAGVVAAAGLLGALLYDSMKGDPPVHTLTVEVDKTFRPSRPEAWKTSSLMISNPLSEPPNR